MRKSHLSTLVAATLGMALSIGPTAAAQEPGPDEGTSDDGVALNRDLEAVLDDPVRIDEAVQEDIEFRELFYLDAEPDYVRSLYEDPDLTVGTRTNGALLTPDELAEMQARDGLVEDADLVIEYYEIEHPEAAGDFAGLEIDHEAGGVLAVYLTPDAPTPWLGQLRQPERLDPRSAEVSLDELRAQQTDFDRRWEDAQRLPPEEQQRLFPETEGLVSTSIDVTNNEVVLGYTELGPAQRDFEVRNEQVRIELEERPTTGGKVFAKGGWAIGTSGCTFGFKVHKEKTPHKSDRYMVTAGHCFPDIPTTIYHNGRLLGKAVAKRFGDGSGTDVALVRVSGKTKKPTFRPVPRVVHNIGGEPYILDIEGKLKRHSKGTKICMTGVSSNTRCGVINRPEVTLWLDDDCCSGAQDVPVKDLVEVKGIFRTQGDSGGPAYLHNTKNHTVRIAGLLSAENNEAKPKLAYYVPVQKIEGLNWDVTLAKVRETEGCLLEGQAGTAPKCLTQTPGHLK